MKRVTAGWQNKKQQEFRRSLNTLAANARRLLEDLLEKAAAFCSKFQTASDWLAYIEEQPEVQSLAFGWFQRFKDVEAPQMNVASYRV